MGEEVPWHEVGENIVKKGLGTKHDIANWHRNVLHGALYLKASKGDPECPCSICGEDRENWLHLWDCMAWRASWNWFIELTNRVLPQQEGSTPPADASGAFVYLGLTTQGHVLPKSLDLLHKLIWKFAIQEFTNATVNGAPVREGEALTRATRRFTTRVHSKLFQIRRKMGTEFPKGGHVPLDRFNKDLAPLGRAAKGTNSIDWHTDILPLLRWANAIEPRPEEEDERDAREPGVT